MACQKTKTLSRTSNMGFADRQKITIKTRNKCIKMTKKRKEQKKLILRLIFKTLQNDKLSIFCTKYNLLNKSLTTKRQYVFYSRF